MAAANPQAPDKLVVAITARALFDLEKGHALFEDHGLDAYAEHQRSHEDEILEPGIAFPLVRKLLAMNVGAPTTIIASTCPATRLTASWRLVVA